MRLLSALVLSAGLLVSACGGGQTDTTEAEERLNNDLQPSAPSPGTVVPEGGEGNQMNGSATASPGANSQ